MRAKRKSRPEAEFIKPQYCSLSIVQLDASPQRAIALASSTPLVERQPKRACQRPQQIRGKIIQPGIAAGQETLMPFIDQAQQQRACHSQQHHARAGAPAGQANGGADQRKKREMRELIPWGRDQIHSKGLCAADEKRASYYRKQHRRNNARVA